jgi:hypothetical protein
MPKENKHPIGEYSPTLVILFVLRDYVACEGIPWKMIQMFSLL